MSRINEPGSPESSATTEQMRQKASEAGQNIREMGAQAKDVAREQMEKLRQQASEYYEHSRRRAMEWEQNLEGYIQDQPVKSLLIAAGVGFVLGAIWKRS